MDGNYVINIGRQLGSGGSEVAQRLAQRFGFSFYDKELIDLVSTESGFCKEFFERVDERTSQTIFTGLMDVHFPFVGDGTVACNSYLSHDSLFKMQSDLIRKLAREKSCVFVGRCADYILRDHPRCVNVFVAASKEDRVKRLCASRNVNEKTALDMMDKTDKKRADYYNYYTCKTWGSAASYHLCVNSSILGLDDTVGFIEAFIRKKLSLPLYE